MSRNLLLVDPYGRREWCRLLSCRVVVLGRFEIFLLGMYLCFFCIFGIVHSSLFSNRILLFSRSFHISPPRLMPNFGQNLLWLVVLRRLRSVHVRWMGIVGSRAVVAMSWIPWILMHHSLVMYSLFLWCSASVIGRLIIILGLRHVVILVIKVEVLHVIAWGHIWRHLIVKAAHHGLGSNMHIRFRRLAHLIMAR